MFWSLNFIKVCIYVVLHIMCNKVLIHKSYGNIAVCSLARNRPRIKYSQVSSVAQNEPRPFIFLLAFRCTIVRRHDWNFYLWHFFQPTNSQHNFSTGMLLSFIWLNLVQRWVEESSRRRVKFFSQRSVHWHMMVDGMLERQNKLKWSLLKSYLLFFIISWKKCA